MSSNEPSSYYKYCPIYDVTGFNKDSDKCTEYALKNLFNCVQRFSSRSSFNDIFDTQFSVEYPKRKEVKSLKSKIKNKGALSLFKREVAAESWDYFINNFPNKAEKIWDDYRIYCVTDKPDNNLMWGHYANCHKGFCIEWDSQYVPALKVKYVDTVPSFKFVDFLKVRYGIEDNRNLLNQIDTMFHFKLKEWDYENEYRFILDNEGREKLVKPEHKFDDFSLVEFEPDQINSIIFGAKTSNEVKQFIVSNIPYNVKFKEAYIDPVTRSSIKIRDYT